MANQIDALINVKDASGVLNEIYPITKKENVQGLAELVNSCLSKSGGTMTGALTLKGAPTADLQAATKKYVDNLAPLTIKASSITSVETMNSAMYSIIGAGIGTKVREVFLVKGEKIYRLNYVNMNMAVFECVSTEIIRTATLSFDTDSISYDVYNMSELKPKAHKVTLTVAGWDSTAKTQTVNVADVLADETKQLILPMPTSASMTAYTEAGIMCTGQAAGKLTFTADTVPTAAIEVYVTISNVNYS